MRHRTATSMTSMCSKPFHVFPKHSGALACPTSRIKRMDAKWRIPADDYFIKLETWSKQKRSPREEQPRGQLIDFLLARARRQVREPDHENPDPRAVDKAGKDQK